MEKTFWPLTFRLGFIEEKVLSIFKRGFERFLMRCPHGRLWKTFEISLKEVSKFWLMKTSLREVLETFNENILKRGFECF